ncbi:hypothetical protein VN21_14295 [Paraclostridium benzoelyticum]|uniref:Uncharacterized protein n=1 Tax=Paraclostridium benzoelyticum TaxID=1629550 RepID=A0A0M3DDN9_9FIRM|nr:hypothetical protein [Paraclostridium benzoelyticum]KKY00403.1 hypothetical protein VN21_14295 [Paraclostridium benzoelyticum]
MRKIFLTLLIMIMPVTIIVCGGKNQNSIGTISKIEDNLEDMSVKYSLDVFKKDEYDIHIYSEEYHNGKLNKKDLMMESTVSINNQNKNIPIDIYYKDENLSIIVGSSGIELPLDFFNNLENGMAMSILDEKREIQLNKELKVAAYSIGNKDHSTHSINLDEDYQASRNEKDLIIYIKVNSI